MSGDGGGVSGDGGGGFVGEEAGDERPADDSGTGSGSVVLVGAARPRRRGVGRRGDEGEGFVRRMVNLG